MSVNLTITIPVDLKIIADLKSGKKLAESSGGTKCEKQLTKALVRAAIKLPYDITPSASSEVGRFNITFKALTGKSFEVEVQSHMTIESIAYMVREHNGMPVDTMRFIHNRCQIYSPWEDEESDTFNKRSLAEIGIHGATIIFIVSTIRGS